MKRMKLRYAGTCTQCGRPLPAGLEAIYDRTTKTVRCLECNLEVNTAAVHSEQAVDDPSPEIPGVAG